MCVLGCCVSSFSGRDVSSRIEKGRQRQQNKYTIFQCFLCAVIAEKYSSSSDKNRYWNLVVIFNFFFFNFFFWNNFIFFSQKTKTHTLFFVHNRCNNSSSSSTSCKGVFCSHQKSYSISCIGGEIEGGAMIMRRAEKFYNREIFFRDGSKLVFKSIFWQCHLFVI